MTAEAAFFVTLLLPSLGSVFQSLSPLPPLLPTASGPLPLSRGRWLNKHPATYWVGHLAVPPSSLWESGDGVSVFLPRMRRGHNEGPGTCPGNIRVTGSVSPVPRGSGPCRDDDAQGACPRKHGLKHKTKGLQKSRWGPKPALKISRRRRMWAVCVLEYPWQKKQAELGPGAGDARHPRG